MKKVFLLNMPVFHKGYFKVLETLIDEIEAVYILDLDLVRELSEFELDIHTLETDDVVKILQSLNFLNVKLVSSSMLYTLNDYQLIMINDEVSRNLSQKYFPDMEIRWVNTFLYWDREKVLAEYPVNFEISCKEFDLKMMRAAYEEAKKSADCWRQVGAVVVIDGIIKLRGYNRGLPNDHNLAMLQNKRNVLRVGEKPNKSPTLHAEKTIITQAAKQGIALKDSSIYVTHFPCEDCAMFIATAGFKECFFSEGSSNIDGKRVLEATNVSIKHIPLTEKGEL